MDIFDYIKKYGNYSFSEKKFNEVDNIIFSSLAYIDFSSIVSSNFSNKITIQEAGDIYFQRYGKAVEKKIIPMLRTGVLILKQVINKKRYKDILIHNYQYESSENTQFGALSFDIDEKLVYVSFEGTDHLISGWREDCAIFYSFPVTAQKFAIKYLNRYIFNRKQLIVGGHSKGGHLAVVASMYCNYFIKKRIIRIYSNDGLGIRQKESKSKKYISIKDRIIKFIPDYSIIGHLLISDSKKIIIKSSKKNFLSHNPNSWIIKNNKFERSRNSKFCRVLEDAFNKWLDQYDEDTKINFVNSVFSVFNDNSIETLYDLKSKKRILLKLILDSNSIDTSTKEMFKQLYYILKECSRKYKEEKR